MVGCKGMKGKEMRCMMMGPKKLMVGSMKEYKEVRCMVMVVCMKEYKEMVMGCKEMMPKMLGYMMRGCKEMRGWGWYEMTSMVPNMMWN